MFPPELSIQLYQEQGTRGDIHRWKQSPLLEHNQLSCWLEAYHHQRWFMSSPHKPGWLSAPAKCRWRWFQCNDSTQVLLPPDMAFRYFRFKEFSTNAALREQYDTIHKSFVKACIQARTTHPYYGIPTSSQRYALPWRFSCPEIDQFLDIYSPMDDHIAQEVQDLRLTNEMDEAGRVSVPDMYGRCWVSVEHGGQRLHILCPPDAVFQYVLYRRATDTGKPYRQILVQRGEDVWEPVRDFLNQCIQQATIISEPGKPSYGVIHDRTFHSSVLDAALRDYEIYIAEKVTATPQESVIPTTSLLLSPAPTADTATPPTLLLSPALAPSSDEEEIIVIPPSPPLSSIDDPEPIPELPRPLKRRHHTVSSGLRPEERPSPSPPRHQPPVPRNSPSSLFETIPEEEEPEPSRDDEARLWSILYNIEQARQRLSELAPPPPASGNSSAPSTPPRTLDIIMEEEEEEEDEEEDHTEVDDDELHTPEPTIVESIVEGKETGTKKGWIKFLKKTLRILRI